MNSTTKLQRSENFVFNEIDNEVVMMNLDTGGYISLNTTGKEIWNLLSEPSTSDEIIDALSKKYNAEKDVISNDITPFLEEMIEKEILLSVN